MDDKTRLNALTEKIIGGAIAVHRELGPGLLESAYEKCLAFELAVGGLSVECQKPLPLVYRGVSIDCAYRLDVVVEREVIVEVKAIDQISGVHEAQMLAYLRLSQQKVGLLINFNVKFLAERGVRRFVNGFPD